MVARPHYPATKLEQTVWRVDIGSRIAFTYAIITIEERGKYNKWCIEQFAYYLFARNLKKQTRLTLATAE